MLPNRAFVLGVLVCLWSGVSLAGPVVFVNDYDGFLAAAGEVRTIDFETLPDGSPPIGRTYITPEFNYTAQGITFSSPRPSLFISGGPQSGFSLEADSYPLFERNWIIANVLPNASAFGVFTAGHTTLTVFDESGDLIASAPAGGGVPNPFTGIVSDVPIARAITDRGSSFDFADAFVFVPVPEPAGCLLILLGAGAVFLRRTGIGAGW